MMQKRLSCVLILITAGACSATIVGKRNDTCPVCKKGITVTEIASFGGYIFDWESKYDLIYFPYTDERFVYLCANCGYAQVSKYFFDISNKEQTKLREFLADKWKPQTPHDLSAQTRFDQAILVNRLLKKDQHFWAWFNRILIYHYRKADPDKAKTYAKTEIELLRKNKGKFDEPRKNRLYLLGEYNRMIGNNQTASNYLQAARKVNLAFQARQDMVLFSFIDFILLAALPVLWIKIISTTKRRILYTLLIALGILILSVFIIYVSPKLIRRREFLNDYYNGIIEDRLQLLDNKG